jgi:hypothetical protein
MTAKTSLPRRASVLAAVVLFTALVACGKKGMPEECDQYLARYECWLGKTGMAASDVSQTVGGMRTTWTEASKTGPGRNGVLEACKKSQGEMEAKFASTGCANAAPAKK